tara:strand:+ start:455 stop:1009 length:555 start_codon:yes stop_codon:yes gene_type:complete
MKKWIGYYQNIVSDELCDKLIDYSENQKPLQPSTYSTSSGKSNRSEERVKMDDGWFRDGEQYYEDIKYYFMSALKLYRKTHPDCVCQRHTDFRFNKYSKGGFMSRHVDNIHHSHGQEYGYPQLSALLFLNECQVDYKGGEFVVADISYSTKKGSAILFPSNFMFPHEVRKIWEGTRYSIVTWLM